MWNFCFVDCKNLWLLHNSLFCVGFEVTADAKVNKIVPKFTDYGPVGLG
jgi:hypothetical protein